MTKTEAIVKAVHNLATVHGKIVGGLRARGLEIRDRAEAILLEATDDERFRREFFDEVKSGKYGFSVAWAAIEYEGLERPNYSRLRNLSGAAKESRRRKLRREAWRKINDAWNDFNESRLCISMAQVYSIRKAIQHTHNRVYDCRTYDGQDARNMREAI
jgi:hypothetical protein